MEKWKKIGRALLFPPMGVLWLLAGPAIALLVYGMAVLGDSHPVTVASYVLAAYTLTLWCCRIPQIISFFRKLKNENKYVRIWRGDVRLRVNIGLFGGFAWNAAYALFQLCLGLYHRSFWFSSLAVYYLLLGLMRLSLAGFTRSHKPGEDMAAELKKYRGCGVVLLFMNLALALIIFFLVYWNRTFHHHPITAIAMAAYTFGSFTLATVNVVRYRRLGSPAYSAAKAISLAAACVSMLTLEATMLTAFGDGSMGLTDRRIFLGATGAAVSAFIIGMAVYMIRRANQQLKSRN